jgi:ABC-type Fe3+ transport system permease subunit
LGEKVGAHKAVLAKLRKRESMSHEEIEYATELVSDARSPLAYAIPGAVFAMGFFYVVGCLHELEVHGGNPSFRTFIGGIPMLASMNMAGQLHRVARLKKRLRDVAVPAPEPSDELPQAGWT